MIGSLTVQRRIPHGKFWIRLHATLVFSLSLIILYDVYALPPRAVLERSTFAVIGMVLLGAGVEILRRGRLAYLAAQIPSLFLFIFTTHTIGKFGFLFYGIRIEVLWSLSLATLLLGLLAAVRDRLIKVSTEKKRKAFKQASWALALIFLALLIAYFIIYFARISPESRHYKPEPFETLVTRLHVSPSQACRRNEALGLCIPESINLKKKGAKQWSACLPEKGYLWVSTDVTNLEKTMKGLPVLSPAEYMYAIMTSRIGLMSLAIRQGLIKPEAGALAATHVNYYTIDQASMRGIISVRENIKKPETYVWAVLDVKAKGHTVELDSAHARLDQALLPLALLVEAMDSDD